MPTETHVEPGRLSAESFTFWLQGFAEIHGGPPTDKQWEVIKEHLELVFTRVTVKMVPEQAKMSPITVSGGATSLSWSGPTTSGGFGGILLC